MPSSLVKTGLFLVTGLALTLALTACGGSGDSKDLEDAIAVGRLDTVEIYITSEEGKLLFEPGETWQFFAVSVDNDGNKKVTDDSVSWSSSDANLVAINQKGQAQMGELEGVQDVSLMIQLGGLTDELIITVSSAELVQVEPSPTDDPLRECQNTAFSANGIYADGGSRPLLDTVTWSTDQPSVASFSENVLVSHNSGLVNVRVEASTEVTGNYPLTITDTLTAITVSDGEPLRLFVGDEITLTATGDYNDGSSNLDISQNSNWVLADTDIASLSGQTLTALEIGSGSVSVSCGGITETVVVDVVEFDDISIIDPKPGVELVEDETRELELYKVYSNDDVDTENIASEATWRLVQGDSIADIDRSGVLTMTDDFSDYRSDKIRVEAEFEGFISEIVILIFEE